MENIKKSWELTAIINSLDPNLRLQFHNYLKEDFLLLQYEDILNYGFPPRLQQRFWEGIRRECLENPNSCPVLQRKGNLFQTLHQQLKIQNLEIYAHDFHAEQLDLTLYHQWIREKSGFPLKSVKTLGEQLQIKNALVPTEKTSTPHSTAQGSDYNVGGRDGKPKRDVRWWEKSDYCSGVCTCTDLEVNQAIASVDLFGINFLRQNAEFLALTQFTNTQFLNILLEMGVINSFQKMELMSCTDPYERSLQLIESIKFSNKLNLTDFLLALLKVGNPRANYVSQNLILGLLTSLNATQSLAIEERGVSSPSTSSSKNSKIKKRTIRKISSIEQFTRGNMYKKVVELLIKEGPPPICRMTRVVNCIHFKLFERLKVLWFRAHPIPSASMVQIVNFDSHNFRHLDALYLENTNLTNQNVRNIVENIPALETLIVQNRRARTVKNLFCTNELESILEAILSKYKEFYVTPVSWTEYQDSDVDGRKRIHEQHHLYASKYCDGDLETRNFYSQPYIQRWKIDPYDLDEHGVLVKPNYLPYFLIEFREINYLTNLSAFRFPDKVTHTEFVDCDSKSLPPILNLIQQVFKNVNHTSFKYNLSSLSIKKDVKEEDRKPILCSKIDSYLVTMKTDRELRNTSNPFTPNPHKDTILDPSSRETKMREGNWTKCFKQSFYGKDKEYVMEEKVVKSRDPSKDMENHVVDLVNFSGIFCSNLTFRDGDSWRDFSQNNRILIDLSPCPISPIINVLGKITLDKVHVTTRALLFLLNRTGTVSLKLARTKVEQRENGDERTSKCFTIQGRSGLKELHLFHSSLQDCLLSELRVSCPSLESLWVEGSGGKPKDDLKILDTLGMYNVLRHFPHVLNFNLIGDHWILDEWEVEKGDVRNSRDFPQVFDNWFRLLVLKRIELHEISICLETFWLILCLPNGEVVNLDKVNFVTGVDRLSKQFDQNFAMVGETQGRWKKTVYSNIEILILRNIQWNSQPLSNYMDIFVHPTNPEGVKIEFGLVKFLQFAFPSKTTIDNLLLENIYKSFPSLSFLGLSGEVMDHHKFVEGYLENLGCQKLHEDSTIESKNCDHLDSTIEFKTLFLSPQAIFRSILNLSKNLTRFVMKYVEVTSDPSFPVDFKAEDEEERMGMWGLGMDNNLHFNCRNSSLKSLEIGLEGSQPFFISILIHQILKVCCHSIEKLELQFIELNFIPVLPMKGLEFDRLKLFECQHGILDFKDCNEIKWKIVFPQVETLLLATVYLPMNCPRVYCNNLEIFQLIFPNLKELRIKVQLHLKSEEFPELKLDCTNYKELSGYLNSISRLESATEMSGESWRSGMIKLPDLFFQFDPTERVKGVGDEFEGFDWPVLDAFVLNVGDYMSKVTDDFVVCLNSRVRFRAKMVRLTGLHYVDLDVDQSRGLVGGLKGVKGDVNVEEKKPSCMEEIHISHSYITGKQVLAVVRNWMEYTDLHVELRQDGDFYFEDDEYKQVGLNYDGLSTISRMGRKE